MKFEETKVFAKIDPYFQRLLERRQRGLARPATSSTGLDEIAVIARVKDPDAWRALSEVHEGATVGQAPDQTWIVTARVPASRIEAVRQAAPVVSLKPARRLRPLLHATIEEINASDGLLPADAQGQQGSDVVVGIVDFGCDFQHENFRHADGTSRILAIWDQNASARHDSPFGYGRLYGQQEIDNALQQPDPYDALGYGPQPDSFFGPRGTHGTHVMDIAAGNGRGSGVPGVAPGADIVFVDLAASDVPWQGPEVVGQNFGDSVQLLEAVRFIFDLAGDRPCVVNLSLGTNGGPHDGSSLVEQGLDALVSDHPNRAVVIAASNSFDDGIHAAGNVPAGGQADVRWIVPVSDFTDNELEIWYSKDDEFDLELIAPDGQSLGSVGLGSNGRLLDDAGNVLIFVSHRAQDPNNDDNTVNVFLESGLPTGTWTLRLHGQQVSDGSYHAWIERDDRAPSSFPEPRDNSHTLGSISTGRLSVAVGSYDAHKEAKPLSWFSSAGPTRDGREKPEISGPGHDVLAAHSRTGTGVVRKSGTSMAAPAVTGVVALMLAEARARGSELSVGTIREVLQLAARSDPPPDQGWNDRYGDGRIDANAAVQSVIDQISAQA
ncbi:MAG: S8 family peptidase [Alphaproteobacteria bacterium]|nr:S8 family peptidase [Alphaproteobacteria bacterium]